MRARGRRRGPASKLASSGASAFSADGSMEAVSSSDRAGALSPLVEPTRRARRHSRRQLALQGQERRRTSLRDRRARDGPAARRCSCWDRVARAVLTPTRSSVSFDARAAGMPRGSPAHRARTRRRGACRQKQRPSASEPHPRDGGGEHGEARLAPTTRLYSALATSRPTRRRPPSRTRTHAHALLTQPSRTRIPLFDRPPRGRAAGSPGHRPSRNMSRRANLARSSRGGPCAA